MFSFFLALRMLRSLTRSAVLTRAAALGLLEKPKSRSGGRQNKGIRSKETRSAP
jgi:hypothetical protein